MVVVAAFTGTCSDTVPSIVKALAALQGAASEFRGCGSAKSRRDADAGISGLMILGMTDLISNPRKLASRVRVAYPAESRAQLGVVELPQAHQTCCNADVIGSELWNGGFVSEIGVRVTPCHAVYGLSACWGEWGYFG